MYAIIEDSGAQRKVQQNETILVDLLSGGEAKAGESISFDRVLVVGDAGGGARIGTPYVDGASVSAEIVEPVVAGDKVHIYKFKPKVGYRRKTGHRQRYTAVRITGITG